MKTRIIIILFLFAAAICTSQITNANLIGTYNVTIREYNCSVPTNTQVGELYISSNSVCLLGKDSSYTNGSKFYSSISFTVAPSDSSIHGCGGDVNLASGKYFQGDSIHLYLYYYFGSQCVHEYFGRKKCSGLMPLTASSSSSMICTGESATLTVSGASSYTWSNGANGSSIVVSPTVTTTYGIAGTTSNGCPINSNITQNVNACIGITEYEKSNLRIFPNPAREMIFIKGYNADLGNSVIEVVNLMGQSLIKKEFHESVDISSLQPGIYFLKLNIENQNSYHRFVKE